MIITYKLLLSNIDRRAKFGAKKIERMLAARRKFEERNGDVSGPLSVVSC